MKIRRTVAGTGAVVLLGVALGYLTAWLSLARCGDAAFDDIQAQGVTGMDWVGAKVVPTRGEMTAEVTGPFLVRTRLMVPFDLHGTLYIRRCLALPWGCYELRSDVFPLVGGPRRSVPVA